jgi:succinate dehydrogenase / fumarate reductase cytochrome b subunit
MAGNIDRAGRPLSPHLQIYRWQWTMALSILHRATGVALVAGTLLLVWWLTAAAYGEDAYQGARGFIGSILGRVLLFGWTLAFFYHLCNGIRHLVWDAGRGFDLKVAHRSAILVLLATAGLTLVTWIAAYAAMGRL